MIRFHPKKGTILMCDFSEGFKPPEMVKTRPVIVVSPKLNGRHGLCTVVALSTVEPNPFYPFHHKMSRESLVSLPAAESWAKCDMIYSVSFERLDRIKMIMEGGRREYTTGKATPEDLLAVDEAILRGLGLVRYLK